MKYVGIVFLLLSAAVAEDACDSGSAATLLHSSLLQVGAGRQHVASQHAPANGNRNFIKKDSVASIQSWGVPAVPATSRINRIIKKSKLGRAQRRLLTTGKRSRHAHLPGARQQKLTESISGMPWTVEADKVYALGSSLSPESDKFSSHSYQTMYGTFLGPLSGASFKPKLLEIGLGCNMQYGPGASVKLWKELLPNAELWETDVDAECVEHSRSEGKLDNVNVLTGDQANVTVLNQWLQISGGNFDVVIDDGGHSNRQIKTSFDVLWPAVKPGGLYFIEDMHVGRHAGYDDTDGKMVMSDVIQAWIEQLIIAKSWAKDITKDVNATALKWPLPDGVDFVMCQPEACVVGKSPANR